MTQRIPLPLQALQLVDEVTGELPTKSAPPPAAGGTEAPVAQAQQGRGERGASTMGGQTALLYAARDGQLEAARVLVESGANVNQGNAEEKTTPLLMAIINGHYDVAKMLLDHKADPNIANVWGLAALYATIDVQWAPYSWFPQPITSQEKVTYLELMKGLARSWRRCERAARQEDLGSRLR